MFSFKDKKSNFFKIICASLVLVFFFSFVLPQDALATRTNAGGGDIVEFSWTDFALTAALAVAGSFVSTCFSNWWNGESSLLSNMNYDTFAMGYSTAVAGSQVGRAVGAAGSYYEWDRRITYLASAIAVYATGSALNPSLALGEALKNPNGIEAMLKGAGVGALAGLLEGGTVVLVAGDDIKKGEKISPLAQLLGQVVGQFGIYVGRGMFSDRPLNLIIGDDYINIRRDAATILTRAAGAGIVELIAKNDENVAILVRGLTNAIASPLINQAMGANVQQYADGQIKRKEDVASSDGKTLVSRAPGDLRDAEPTRSDLSKEILRGFIQSSITGGLYAAVSGRWDYKDRPTEFLLASMVANLGAQAAGMALDKADISLSGEQTDQQKDSSGKLMPSTETNYKKGLSSIAAHNFESGLSFGLPNQVSSGASQWMNYLGRLKNFSGLYSSYGLVSALSYNFGDTFLSSAGQNLVNDMYLITGSEYLHPVLGVDSYITQKQILPRN